MGMETIWQSCLKSIQSEIPSQQFNTWLRPLQSEESNEQLILFAPNIFVMDWVKDKYLPKLRDIAQMYARNTDYAVEIKVGSLEILAKQESARNQNTVIESVPGKKKSHKSNLNPDFRFETFVEGKANQLALAAARQVAENPGAGYNPFFIYGGVGLGKTHLMHAVGNEILKKRSDAKILYLHSERFVADMVKALQTNTIDRFKKYINYVTLILAH